MTRRVLIESPFAGNTVLNKRYLAACLRDSLLRGEAPFASHRQYTGRGILDDHVPAEREMGINAGLAWGRVADATVCYMDLGISSGMKKGIEDATQHGRAIEYRWLRGVWTRERAA
jgi:hypothetical protein